MRRTTGLWIGVVALCVTGTVYENPNIAKNVRYYTNLVVDAQDYPNFVISDRLMAEDPEAGHLSRLALKHRYDDPAADDLVALLAQYPDNEYLLALFVENLVAVRDLPPLAALAVVDRLIALAPQNAHYRYLRGWVVQSRTPGAQAVRAALAEFEQGHRLPEFYLPYAKYKDRIDALCEKAALRRYERPGMRRSYWSFGAFGTRLRDETPEETGPLLDDLATSVATWADRMIDSACDLEALENGQLLLQKAEEARLHALDLSDDKARQTRQRLARAAALDELRWETSFDDYMLESSSIGALPWLFPLTLVPLLFGKRPKRRAQASLKQTGKSELRSTTLFAAFVAVLLLAALAWDGLRPLGTAPPSIVNILCLGWFFSFPGLAYAQTVEHSHRRPRQFWTLLLHQLLWLNGLLILVFAQWGLRGAPGLPTFAVVLWWSGLCVALWLLAIERVPSSNRKRRALYLGLLLGWAAALVAFHVFGAEWHRTAQRLADPLAKCQPLPAATEEQYQRMVVHGQPPSYRRDDPGALPKHIAYAAPKDMDEFIARRRKMGYPLTEDQLTGFLGQCGRDTWPVVLDAIENTKTQRLFWTRALWGDMTVKPPFEHYFEQHTRVLSERDTDTELDKSKRQRLHGAIYQAGALAYLSPPEVATERFARVLEFVVDAARRRGQEPRDQETARNWIVDRFLEGLDHLPQAQAGPLFGAYLRQTRFADLAGPGSGVHVDRLAARLADAAPQLAGDILPMLLAPWRSEDPNAQPAASRQAFCLKCLEALGPALTERTIPLLLECLDIENQNVRAILVRHLTTLGYQWPPERRRDLLADASWRIRLNVLPGCAREDLNAATTDVNARVRALAYALVSAQTKPRERRNL